MTRAAVGLGSNVGDRLEYLRTGVAGLATVADIVARSSVYETEPIGNVDQGPFLNAVVVCETVLTAPALLAHMHLLETEAGRQRIEKWGPRTLDLDLLLFGDSALAEDGVALPHPRMTERRFVLEPLVEAWPGAVMPDGRRVVDFLDAVADQEVTKLEGAAL